MGKAATEHELTLHMHRYYLLFTTYSLLLTLYYLLFTTDSQGSNGARADVAHGSAAEDGERAPQTPGLGSRV
jgi:hypothetical protein